VTTNPKPLPMDNAFTVAPQATDLSPILFALREIHGKYQRDLSGKVATYIPELAKADPNLFGVTLITADGHAYEVGESRHLFTMQSISKPFVYGFALEDHGLDYVMTKVGVEPSGEAFNSIILDERRNRPFNPMVNAGAIATTALIKGNGHDQRLARMLEKFSHLAGRSLDIDHAVYVSERATGHRNRAIGYLELNFGMLDEPVSEHLDLYFEQCSILVSARDLAIMAATLANNGVNPITGKRAIEESYVKNILSVMHTCGMYYYAGEWTYRIGFPAKSGVGGGIIAVLPGQFGIGTFSAPLDDQGNSHRGIRVCEEFSERFKLHMFKTRSVAGVVVRRLYRRHSVRSKRRRGQAADDILNRIGSTVCVLELQGSLFFSTMEQVLRRVTEELETFSYLILDLKRVLQIDECSAALLSQTDEMLRSKNKTLVLAEAPTYCAELFQDGVSPLSIAAIDSALECCEDRLLQQAAPEVLRDDGQIALAAMDILTGFAPSEIALIESVLQEVRYAPGEIIIREGERADSLFLLSAGRVSICLSIQNGSRRQRLSTIGPGLAFGELALLDGGSRSADVIADEPTLCYRLPTIELEALGKYHPDIQNKLIYNIGRELSARLRRAEAGIRALAN
jgi:glutaminase